jgi:hypothetical protein
MIAGVVGDPGGNLKEKQVTTKFESRMKNSLNDFLKGFYMLFFSFICPTGMIISIHQTILSACFLLWSPMTLPNFLLDSSFR